MTGSLKQDVVIGHHFGIYLTGWNKICGLSLIDSPTLTCLASARLNRLVLRGALKTSLLGFLWS